MGVKAEDHYKNNFADDVAYAPNMKPVDLSPYQEGIEKYYNHAMALLELSPTQIDVSYYQFPSWDSDFQPPTTVTPTLLVKETITPMPPRSV